MRNIERLEEQGIRNGIRDLPGGETCDVDVGRDCDSAMRLPARVERLETLMPTPAMRWV